MDDIRRVGGELVLLEWFFVIKQLAKVDKANAARTCRLRFPIGAPFPQDKLFECVDTDAEGVGLTDICVFRDRHVALSEIPGIDLIRMAGARGEEQSDLADGAISDPRRHRSDIILGRADGQDGVGAILSSGGGAAAAGVSLLLLLDSSLSVELAFAAAAASVLSGAAVVSATGAEPVFRAEVVGGAAAEDDSGCD